MSRDITLLHPEVQAIIPKFLEECKKNGLIVGISQTFRTEKEQNDLYAQGRTKPGNIVTNAKYPYSNHNWGMAFDIYRNDGKGIYNDTDNWFAKVGSIAVKLGFEWGGNWKGFPDKPHIEFTKYGNTTTLAKKYGTPENFKKTWKEVDKYMFVTRNYSYNGKTKAFTVINEKGENFIKIRDLAELLNKNIKYDANTKITNLEDILENINVEANNKKVTVKAINSGGFNFVKVRDLADFLGFETGYNETNNSIFFKLKQSILDKIFKK
ncbi:M15 family metallopeptidase [[Clostridium] colinum]|uniref:M15 family metallopeptidase n=1 Tax=[Clostridium] colinum TaxID=36835 RepID=UPI002023CD5E|nr:M15 family metallopeptidase [[Clostridium] colinum]